MGYSKVNVHEIEGSGPGGGVRFVRRELGVEAFGINWFEIPPDAEGVAHDDRDLLLPGLALVVLAADRARR